MFETESQEILVDFGKICRLCLTGDGVLINLFSMDSVVENGSKSIPDKIMDLMSFMVVRNDGFPSWICHNCLSQVDKCYEFFDQCRTNQAALNESYLAALSEAGVNIVSMKGKYQGGDCEEVKSEEKLIEVYNPSQLNSPKKELEKTLQQEVGEEEEEGEEEEDEEEDEECENGNGTKDLNDQFYCSYCSRAFSKADEYLVHHVTVHGDRSGDTSTRPDGKTVPGSGLYDCDLCGAKFHNKNAITTHVRFKHLKVTENPDRGGSELEKLVFCKYCGLSFSRKNMTRHLEVVHRMTRNTETDQRDVGSFDCRICYRPFLRQSSLRSHIEKVHGDSLETMAEVENCEIVWNCSECESVFLEEVNLIQHYGQKHSKYPLEVDALRALKSRNLICGCGVISSNSFDASLHAVFSHSDDQVQPSESRECPGCDRTFTDVTELKVHLISFHWFSSMTYENECVFCGLAFNTNDSLRLHLTDSHQINFEKNLLEEAKVSGSGCGSGSTNSNNNNNTGTTAGGVGASRKKKEEQKLTVPDVGAEPEQFRNLFVCETCGEFYKTEKEFHGHVKSCPFSHKCQLCGKGYKTSTHLKRHVAEFHNTLSPIKCPLCPKIFPRKMNLHHHYKRRHLKQTKKFVCSYCGQSLKGIVALRSHEDRLHRNVRNYKCSDCPEAFTTRGILRKHAQRHLTERPMLQCQFCEKKFSTISGIERHIKTHEGVKEFQCDTPHCGKSFYTKSELKRHIKFHTRDFKHVCPVCGHKFMSPGELKKHSTKHTGERPFKCHLCSCAYARRDDKVKHLKRVHNLRVKRVYGRSLVKSGTGQEDTALVDTIVIDDGTDAAATETANAAAFVQ